MVTSMATKIKNATSACIRKFRTAFNIPVVYRYKEFSILVPASHLLPEYQKRHPKYDRFLPHLAKFIAPSDTIIDIGANVGDTLAGMAEHNSTSRYVCIEPDDSFYEHLQKNIERIKNSKTDLRVHTIKSLVGKGISGVSLDGKGGTKHAVVDNSGSIKSKTLDELLSRTDYSNIRMLKTDVDGFDYDVLDSSAAVIREYKPILFCEVQYDFEYQMNGYEKTLRALESEGYCDWTIFDNFGEIVLRTKSLAIVVQLMRYVWNQNTGRTTRTIYYYDVLAVQESDSNLIDRVLSDYD